MVSASIALAGLAVAYALASSVDRNASHTIAALVQRSSAWVVPAGGFAISNTTGALHPRRAFDVATARHVRDAVRRLNLRVTAVQVLEVRAAGGGVAVYYLGSPGRQRIIYDRATITRPSVAFIARELGPVEFVSSELGAAIVLVEGPTVPPKGEGRFASPDWLLIPRDSVDHIREELAHSGVKVRIAYGPDSFARSPDADCVIAILERAPTARFSPFSFSTELSAYVVNSVLATRIGLLARAAFLFTLVLTVISARTAVRARRNEIAVFSIFGLEGDLAAVFGIEAALTSSVSLVGGCVIAVMFLMTIAGMTFVECAGALALAAVFAVILCLVDALTRALACSATFQRRSLDSYA